MSPAHARTRDGNGIALVLAGGGARGAYEIGALSKLLPALDERGERPEVIVGTSVGAINATFLAATADDDVKDALREARKLWSELRWRDALMPLLSPAEFAKLSALLIPGVPVWSFLDPAPLEDALKEKLPPLERIRANLARRKLTAAAVVATSVTDSSSVVFHDGGGQPPRDRLRGIDYVQTQLQEDHVRASAAIPSVFPAVQLQTPDGNVGWYYDGGTRLNTPIKPALMLGGRRVIVIALNSLQSAGLDARPEALDGATQIVQALLVDPLVHDALTLSSINEDIEARGPVRSGAKAHHEHVPYILIAPKTPNEIGEAASAVYKRHYAIGKPRAATSVGILGHLLRAGKSASRGELYSYLFFAPEFAKKLMARGEADADRWLEGEHDDGPWRYGRPRDGASAAST